MIGSQRRFKVGQNVRLSRMGIRALCYKGQKAMRIGVVVKVDEFNSPSVLWDGRRTSSAYHPDFIAVIKKPNYGYTDDPQSKSSR